MSLGNKVTIMTNTTEVTLTCITSSPWFFCVWEGPGGERACALREKIGKQGDSLCGEQDRLEVKGNSSMCSLVIKNPEISDHGDWTCAVSDDESLETVKDDVKLEIRAEGMLVIMPGKVELSEGEQVELVCMVEEVFPPPEISWTVSRDMMGTLDTSSNKVIIPSSKSHMVSIQHHVFYTPSLLDHGMNISCMARQGNMSKQVKSVVVRVKKEEVKEMLVEQHVGVIPILSIAACSVFVVLLITSFIIVIIKMRKSKGNQYDIEGIDYEGDQKVKEKQGEDKEEVRDENDPSESIIDVFPNDVHNKSVSSEESNKYSNIVDDISECNSSDNSSDSV